MSDMLTCMRYHALCNEGIILVLIQWNLVIKRSDITIPSCNKVILLVPALYFFTLI